MRRRIWVNLSALLERGIEEGVKDISSAGFEELLLLVSSGDGAFFNSHVRPSKPGYRASSSVEEVIREARKAGLKVHAWIVTLKFSNEDFVKKHPGWYVVNRLGESSAERPPYVKHYKWLCPRKPGVVEFVGNFFVEVASEFDLDGLHFDYIRLPDIILPKGLRAKYPEAPRRESYVPRFDFCYCCSCRRLFESETGVDPMEIGYEDPLYQRFFRWRVDGVSRLVEKVYKAVKDVDAGLEVSAAVFPTPSIAYRYVFQNWPEWPLDLYDPMIYHRYYEKDIEWIGEAVREAVSMNAPVSAGIFLGFMEGPEDVYRAFKLAMDNGAEGITVFVYPPRKPESMEWVREAFKQL